MAFDLSHWSELLSTGIQSVNQSLGTLFQSTVDCQILHLKEVQPGLLEDQFDSSDCWVISQEFIGDLHGEGLLYCADKDALSLVSALYYKDLSEPNEEHEHSTMKSVLAEVGNIAINSLLGAVCNEMEQHITFRIPHTDHTKDLKLYSHRLLRDVRRRQLEHQEILFFSTLLTVKDHDFRGTFVLVLDQKFEQTLQT